MQIRMQTILASLLPLALLATAIPAQNTAPAAMPANAAPSSATPPAPVADEFSADFMAQHVPALLEKALSLDPGEAITMVNTATALEESAILDVIGSEIEPLPV